MNEGKDRAISSYYAALMASLLSGAMHLTAMRLCPRARSGDPWFTSAFSLMPTSYSSVFVSCPFSMVLFSLFMWAASTCSSDDEAGVKL